MAPNAGGLGGQPPRLPPARPGTGGTGGKDARTLAGGLLPRALRRDCANPQRIDAPAPCGRGMTRSLRRSGVVAAFRAGGCAARRQPQQSPDDDQEIPAGYPGRELRGRPKLPLNPPRGLIDDRSETRAAKLWRSRRAARGDDSSRPVGSSGDSHRPTLSSRIKTRAAGCAPANSAGRGRSRPPFAPDAGRS